MALTGQGGQSTASYMESAADWPPTLCATVTPKLKVVYFCAAQWSVFTPPLTPGNRRGENLAEITCPTLICQGTRDPFGTREEVQEYDLSNAVTLHWLEDGDHDLKPRKRVTGKTLEDQLLELAEQVKVWTNSCF